MFEHEKGASIYGMVENGSVISIFPDGDFVFKESVDNPTQYAGDNSYLKKGYFRLRELAEKDSDLF